MKPDFDFVFRAGIRRMIPVLTVILSGAAGWFSLSPPGASAPRDSGHQPLALPSLPPGKSATAGRAGTSVNASGGGLPPVAARFERELLEALDPGALVYSGAELQKLCGGDYARNLPGGNPASDYGSKWAKADPAGMYAWFQAQGLRNFSLPGINTGFSFGNDLFSEWGKQDPGQAVAAALAQEEPNYRRDYLADAIGGLLTSDPAKAAALMAEHMDVLAVRGRSALPFRASNRDYLANLEFLNALPASQGKDILLAGYFNQMVRYHSTETAGLWNALPEKNRRNLVAAGFSAPGIENSGTEYEGFRELWREAAVAEGDPNKIEAVMKDDITKWAKNDPAAAIEWAQENMKGQARVDSAAELFWYGAREHFDETVAVWKSLPEGRLRAMAAGSLAAGAPSGRKAQAEEIVASLPEKDRPSVTVGRNRAFSYGLGR